MGLKIKDIINIIEEYAPEKLKESYDNVGLMVGDENKEITSILMALDCTLDVIEEAKEKGCNFIFTHHPLLFKKPSSITSETLVGKKIMELIKNDISLFSCHTNLDSTEDGLNDIFVKLLNFENYSSRIMETKNIDKESGIGRIISLEKPISLDELINKVKNVCDMKYIRYSGNDEVRNLNKIAIINGSGQDYLPLSKSLGAQCVITGDTTYHYVSDFSEEGICIIDAGHFGTEWPAFKYFASILQNKINSIGFTNKVVISKKVKDPYKIK